MNTKLFLQAIIKFLLGIILVGSLIFLPAGTLRYPNGLLMISILFIPMFLVGVILMFKNPHLLRSRLEAKEKQKEQNLVIKLSGLVFVVGFVIAGLDFRFQWLPLPQGVTFGAAGVFMMAYLLYGEILRENAYLSRTIEVQEGQQVIDSGLYGIVRHPMYSATILLFLSMPLVLGSVYAFIPFIFYPFLIVRRIKHEELFLEQELTGYAEYKQKVKYRLIPFIW